MSDETVVKSFRELIVWQRSIQLCVAVYTFTKTFPSSELYGLQSQLRRAAVSVPSNIAEGFGRRSKGEFLQFLGIASGSNFEVQTQLVIARELEFGLEADRAACVRLSVEVEKMLHSFSRTVATPKASR